MRNEKETVLDMFSHPKPGDQFDRRQTEKELMDIINAKNQELTVLHQVNTRLGYQLNILQKKLGIDPFTVLQQLQKIGEFSVAYHAEVGQFQYLDQLLLAYDQTILKQKKFIAMLYSQMEDAERRAETIIRDNDYLLEENKNKCKKILEIFHRGCPEQNLVTSYNKLQRQMEQQRNMVIREENDHVLGTYHRLQHHAQQIQRELEDSKATAERYFESFKNQSTELKEALLGVDNLLKVKQFLEKKVSSLQDENITLETLKNELETKISKLESEVKSVRSQLFGQKKMSRQQNERASIQVDSLKSETDNAIKRQKQTFNRLMIMEKDFETSKDSLRALKRQNQKIKGDFQQTLKMCEAYESKITSLSRREESVRGLVDQNKEKLDFVLLERDKAHLKVEQLEKILENMNQRHREQLSKTRQSYEKMLSEQQQKLHLIAQQKQQGQSLYLQSELNFKNQIDKLKRENALLHDQNIKFIENIHINTSSEIIGKLKEYEAKNDSLIKLLNQKERTLKDSESRYEETLHELENDARNSNRLLEKEKNMTTQYMKEITQERSRVNILLNEKQCLQNELKKLKKNYDYRNNQMTDERQFRIDELESKLSEAVRKEKETRLKAIQMLEKYDQAEEKLKAQYENRIMEIENENEKLKKKIAKFKQ